MLDLRSQLKPGITGTPLARISQLIDNLSCMRFLQLSYNFAMSCLWCLWGLWEVYEAHRQIRSKKTTSQHLDMSWFCEVISITNGFVYEVYEPHRQIRASGGVTGGFKTTHFQKRHPWDFSEVQRIFGGWGVGWERKSMSCVRLC